MKTRVLPCILAATVLAGCDRGTQPAAPATAPAPQHQATSTPTPWIKAIVPGDMTILEVPARTSAPPEATATVTAPVRVQVRRLLVRVGDRVEQGAAIAEVLAPELVQAAAMHQSATERMAAHKRRLTELRSLKAEGLARTGELFEIESSLASLQADHDHAQAVLRGAGVAEKEWPVLLATGIWTLRAPVGGIVREMAAELGAVLEPGPTSLARIAGDQPARVEIHLHQPLPSGLQLGFVPSTGGVYTLASSPTSTAIDPADGSVIAWYELTDAPPLPPGLRGRVRATSMPQGAVQIPARAIDERQGKPHVVLRQGDGAQWKAVEVLAISGATAVVRGLAVGDEVAAEAERSPLALQERPRD